MRDRNFTIIITGGGTGGHLFPGIAIAKAFLEVNRDNNIIFIGTGNDFETRVLSRHSFTQLKIPAEGFMRRGVKGKMASLGKLPLGLISGLLQHRRLKPDLVLGMGGYSAGPVVLAARLLNISTALHEQNIIPGLTTRLLAPLADRVFLSFDDPLTAKRLPGCNPKKIRITGNPVRREIATFGNITDPSAGVFKVLVTGGSQGARGVNLAVIDAIRRLPDLRRYHFTHQTGALDFDQVAKAYQKLEIQAAVKPFIIDMAEAYGEADLVICRAGATTVAEVSAMGKAVIFIPYPYAADNHQELNAQIRVRVNAAEMIREQELSGELLASRIDFYQNHPDILKKMEKHAKATAKPNAAAEIVRLCYQSLLKAKTGTSGGTR